MKHNKMVREIKFRVWDKKKNRFLDTGVSFTRNGGFEVTSGLISPREEDLDINQFTGLKDKNKVEIYEGDILDWNDELTFEIKWSDEQAGFYYNILTQKNENICAFDIRFYRAEDCAKIIGNIYENPKLLKEE